MSVNTNTSEDEEPKNTMGAWKYAFAFVGALLILAAGLILGRSADIKETNTGNEEKNPVLKLCKRFYGVVAGILKLKKTETPDIYAEVDEKEDVVLPDNEENEVEVLAETEEIIEDDSDVISEETAEELETSEDVESTQDND